MSRRSFLAGVVVAPALGAPAGPGGGRDTTARVVRRTIRETAAADREGGED